MYCVICDKEFDDALRDCPNCDEAQHNPIWVWKHNGKPVNLVEETSDRLYYKVEVIKFADKNKFVKRDNGYSDN